MIKHPSKEFDDALTALLDGSLTEAEAEALGRLLHTDPSARNAYLWQMELHARLLTQDENAVPATASLLTPARRRPSGAPWLALAASVALLAGLAWLFFLSPGEPVRVMAMVLQSEGGNRFRSGQRAEITDLRFVRGSLRLRLDHGVTLDCDAPMDARFESPGRLHLAHGRMNVDASASDNGFTVLTKEGEIVDLGTTFSVEAEEGSAVKVAVFSGQVELRPRQAASANLTQGDAAQFRRRSAPERVHSVPLRQTAGGETKLDLRRHEQPLVVEVSDNLVAGTTRRFYGIVAGGMTEKAKAFVDRPGPVWKGEQGQAFPAELEGADLIQTCQDLRWGSGFELRVTLAQPATIFILHDPRNPPPPWLERDFSKTPLRLRSGSWTQANITMGLTPGPNGRYHIPCEVWKREVTEPGTITLGNPYDPASPIPSAMYGIALKAAPPR